jgi:hypothetical protein
MAQSRGSRRRFLKSGVAGLGGLGIAGAAVGFPESVLAADEHSGKSFKPLYSKLQTQQQAEGGAVSQSDIPSPGVRALRRLTFGYRHEDLAHFNSLGGTFDQRLEAWVDDQLNGYQPVWPPPNDPDLLAAVNASPTEWETLEDSLETIWQERAKAGTPEAGRDLPTQELTALMALRAVYSQWQLAEILADFWHVHFNVDATIGERRSTSIHYDRDVIRPNMLANFRQMIEAVTKSCSMMHYLDNLWNSRWGPNENYARELQELHTLGAVNSYGFTPENEIPVASQMVGSSTVLPAGLKAGYSEADVRQATMCLTGWTIDRVEITGNVNETGDYVYYPDWHEPAPKRVLGIDFASSGEAEVHELLDLLAMHPNTARYVCWKLCRRLVNDDPPESLVEKAALVFNDQWQAPDQLKQVVRTILLSSEFKDPVHWGSKVKKPMELLCGTARSCGGFSLNLGAWDDYKPSVEAPSWEWWEQQSEDHTFTRNFYWGLWESGGLPFRWVTPDGYPDIREAWLASSPLVLSWKHMNFMFVTGRTPPAPQNTWYHFFPVNAHEITRSALAAPDRTAANIVDFWVLRILGYDSEQAGSPQLEPAVRAELVAFMQQDAPSADTALDLDMPLETWSNTTWQAYVPERVQVLVSSIAMLPENMLR